MLAHEIVLLYHHSSKNSPLWHQPELSAIVAKYVYYRSMFERLTYGHSIAFQWIGKATSMQDDALIRST